MGLWANTSPFALPSALEHAKASTLLLCPAEYSTQALQPVRHNHSTSLPSSFAGAITKPTTDAFFSFANAPTSTSEHTIQAPTASLPPSASANNFIYCPSLLLLCGIKPTSHCKCSSQATSDRTCEHQTNTSIPLPTNQSRNSGNNNNRRTPENVASR